MRIMMGCVSGSPKRQLNSSTMGPRAVIMMPQYRMPLYSAPSAFMPAITGRAMWVTSQSRICGVDDLVGGVCSHAAGVRALVVVEDTLVVLRRHQRNHALAVAHHQEGQLFALEKFFQHDTRDPASPSILPLSISSAVRCASSFVCAMTTPLPAASPSALTTIGV